MSKQHQDEVAEERMEQLRIRNEMEARQKEEDDMYAKLWYADMEAKMKREEAETQRQMSANKDTLEVLQMQVAALEEKKEQEKALVAEEAQLLVSVTHTCIPNADRTTSMLQVQYQ